MTFVERRSFRGAGGTGQLVVYSIKQVSF